MSPLEVRLDLTSVYSNGKELATKEYVDANAGGGGGAIANSGQMRT